MTDFPTLAQYAHGERKMIAKLTDNKLFVALIVPVIVWLVAMASGLSALPSRVEDHERRVTHVEGDTRALRESQIRNEEKWAYIVKALERLEKREERRR